MGLDNVIKIGVALTVAACLTGQLPRMTNLVRSARLRLLQESKSSKWGSPDFLYAHKAPTPHRSWATATK